MSYFKMASDLDCPYCGEGQRVSHDDGAGYTEGGRHEMTCRACEKSFVFDTAISFSYTPHKADCLNGADHVMAMSKTYPPRFGKMACKDCDYERSPTPEEFAAAGISLEVDHVSTSE